MKKAPGWHPGLSKETDRSGVHPVIFVEVENSAEAKSRQRVDRMEWLTPEKAAEIAGVHRTTMLRWCIRHRAPLARLVGKRWRVSPLALARFLDGEELTSGNEGTAASRP